MVLVVDAQVAGISGDMVVSGLVDMGASASRVSDAVRDAVAASLPGARLDGVAFEAAVKGGIAATRMTLDGGGDAPGADGGGGGGRHSVAQMRECISRGCKAAGLSAAAARLASDSFEALVSAEAAVHGGAGGAGGGGAHLHEAAGLDTIADVLGAATAADDLGLAGERVACTPVAVGRGTVSFSHGTTPCPAPAVVEALRGSGIALCPGGGAAGAPAGELATPTGASLLRAMRPECMRAYPEMAVEAVGHGAGSADFDGFANVLRLVRGAEESDPRVRSGTVGVLETIIDDATGEELGRAMASLASAAGALDVWATPAVGRKGRPAHALTVVCEAGAERRLARALMGETGTLGVRVRRSDRVEAARSARTLGVRIAGSGPVAVRAKTGALTGREKPESDDVAAAAAAAGVPYRDAARGIAGALRGRGAGADGAGGGSGEVDAGP